MKMGKTNIRSCLLLVGILLCLAAGSLEAVGQVKVRLSGKVTDREGHPVEQATIAIENSSTGCYSHTDGSYELMVTPGRHVVVVSFVGYETLKMPLRIDGPVTQDFRLKESNVGLGTVEVYGKSQTQKLKEGVFAVNALDVKALASSLNDLNSLMDRTTGAAWVRTSICLSTGFRATRYATFWTACHWTAKAAACRWPTCLSASSTA